MFAGTGPTVTLHKPLSSFVSGCGLFRFHSPSTATDDAFGASRRNVIVLSGRTSGDWSSACAMETQAKQAVATTKDNGLFMTLILSDPCRDLLPRIWTVRMQTSLQSQPYWPGNLPVE